ncbi:D-2-hydroxyacid dehydrogenase [Streptomyces sp. NPDC007088]|uniref:D-2-hydroxyacid dehydrogenase n=1 Tax=Streptomyces sp. NPDC007088 TaxID=3364773 RepID=UPI0036835C7A
MSVSAHRGASRPRPSRPRVLVLDGPPGTPRPRLGALLGRAEVAYTDEAGLAAELPRADVLLVWDFLSDAVRDAWPGGGRRPLWTHTASAGVDRLLCPELAASDTVVTNARGVFDQPIAEYVAALVLALAKDLPGTLEAQRRREWRHRESRSVAGTRACVVGTGPIGRAVTTTLGALGVTTALVGRRARAGVHGPEDLDRLLARADWVVCAAPLTEETRGMFGARRFALLQPSAHFLNIGRGQLVDEEALLTALTSRSLAGAALDVFQHEPLPADSPLWTAPGLLVSPHMSGDVAGWRDRLGAQFVDLYEAWADGKPLWNVVDKERGYVPGA